MSDNDSSREASLAALKADIYEGLADLAAGRVKSFNPATTIEGIEAGMRDARAGRTVSHEEAMAEIQAVIDAARRGKT